MRTYQVLRIDSFDRRAAPWFVTATSRWPADSPKNGGFGLNRADCRALGFNDIGVKIWLLTESGEWIQSGVTRRLVRSEFPLPSEKSPQPSFGRLTRRGGRLHRLCWAIGVRGRRIEPVGTGSTNIEVRATLASVAQRHVTEGTSRRREFREVRHASEAFRRGRFGRMHQNGEDCFHDGRSCENL